MIGGLKEKLLAAARAGIKRGLIPKENAKDLEEIPDVIKDSLEIVPVSTIDEVFEAAFAQMPESTGEVERFSGFYELPATSSEKKKPQKTH